MNMALAKVSNSVQLYPDMNTALLEELRDEHDEHGISKGKQLSLAVPRYENALLVELRDEHDEHCIRKGK